MVQQDKGAQKQRGGCETFFLCSVFHCANLFAGLSGHKLIRQFQSVPLNGWFSSKEIIRVVTMWSQLLNCVVVTAAIPEDSC
eukprot:3588744-Amphidinium_carterae.1